MSFKRFVIGALLRQVLHSTPDATTPGSASAEAFLNSPTSNPMLSPVSAITRLRSLTDLLDGAARSMTLGVALAAAASRALYVCVFDCPAYHLATFAHDEHACCDAVTHTRA